MALLPDDPFAEEELPDDPLAVEASSELPDNPIDALPDNPLDEETAEPTLLDRVSEGFDNSIVAGVPVKGIKGVAEVGGNVLDAAIDNPLTRWAAGKQQELLSDPETAGVAGAVIAPVSLLTGLGDTPMAETARENVARTGNVGVGNENTLMAEKVGGMVGRAILTGAAAPVVEGAAKVADIAQHEPEEDLTSLKTAGRGALSAAATYLPMKAGAAVESAVANAGLGRLGGFLANAGADLGLGYAAGTGATVGEKALTGQEITAQDFQPSVLDAGGALLAGLGGARSSGARQAEIQARNAEPVATPERINELETEIQRRIAAENLAEDHMARQDAEAANRGLRAEQTSEAVEAERRRISNIAAIDDGPKQTERLALPAPIDLTSGAYPGRIQPNYPPDPVNARSGLAKASLTQLQEHLGYVPKTEADYKGLGLSPLTKGASNGLQQREVQGETTGRPVNTESQEIAATPEPQAGMGVINLAGDQGAPAAPGRPIGGLGLSAIPVAARSNVPNPAPDYNPNAGQKSLGGIQDEGTQQSLRDLSYQDEAGHQDARRGTITREQTLDAATKMARQQGAQMVNTWQKGKAYTGEELKAIESYTQGVNDELVKAKQAEIDDPTQDNKFRVKELESQLIKSARAIRGGSTEAGRALGALRYVIGGVNTNTPRAADDAMTVDDKARAIAHVDKLYGDKPVPQSVVDEIEALDPDDVVGLATILEKHTRLNNKTSASDAVANTVKAGYLTSVRTLFRSLGGTLANTVIKDADSRLGSMLDWALGKKTGQRTVTSIGLGTSLRNAASATKEGVTEGVAMIRGKYTSEAANKALERFEIQNAQYTGESVLNKLWDGYVNTVFRTTAAVDMPARKFAYKQSLVNQAQVTAKNELASGAISKADYDRRIHELVSKPSDAMLLEAGVQAELAAFADDNMLATGLNSFIRGMTNKLEQRGTAGKAGAAVVKGAQTTVVPFLKTPLNISWDILRRTLLDLPTGVSRGIKYSLQKEKMTAAQQKLVVESIARGGVGTGLATLGYIAGVNGWDWLTGTSEQESSGMKETNKVAGKQDGSITALGKNLRVQDVASPVSNLLILGNSIGREVSKFLKPEDEHKRALNTVGAATKAITENPFFQGVERLSGVTKPGGLTRFVTDTASSVVPNFVGDIATLTDNTQRDAYKQEGDSFGDVLAKSFMRKTPGLRQMLQPRVNAIGEVQKEDKMNVLDPTFSRDARWQKDPAIAELVRLDVGMVKPERKKGESEQQYLARVKKNGDALKKALDSKVTQDNYKNATDDIKRQILDQITHQMSVNRS